VGLSSERLEAEPTLGLVLTRFARTTVPERLYQLLWLGVPFAIDFGISGHWRAAAWGLAVAALGGWGVADRWLWRAARGDRWRRGLVRIVRATAGALAAGVSAILLIELFLRLLGKAPIS
jgi:hypothetical protein